MIRPNDLAGERDASLIDAVHLLMQLRDLADAAQVALDEGDTEAALAAVEHRAELLHQLRGTIELLSTSLGSARQGAAAEDAATDDIYQATRATLDQQSMLTARLREAGEKVARELARIEAGER